jgi:hypothetical protein
MRLRPMSPASSSSNTSIRPLWSIWQIRLHGCGRNPGRSAAACP